MLIHKPASAFSSEQLGKLYIGLFNKSPEPHATLSSPADFDAFCTEHGVVLARSHAFLRPEYPDSPMCLALIAGEDTKRKLVTFGMPPCWRGKGHAQEALGVVLDELRKEGAAAVVEVEVLGENIAAIKAFEKVGFKIQGNRKEGGTKVLLEFVL